MQQAVIISFNYGIKSLDPLIHLEIKLRKAIRDANAGKYDGHEIGIDNSHGLLYMYGTDAHQLFMSVKPTLEQTYFMKGAVASLRLGPAGTEVKEIEIVI